MKNLSLKPNLHLLIPTFSSSSSSSSPPPWCVKLAAVTSCSCAKKAPRKLSVALREERQAKRVLLGAAVSVGVLAALLLSEEKGWALGPEGPLVEEFWDNVRRYGLYALTVSTGALYTILRPILELLRNPVSAIFILALLGASFFILSQVLSAMFGISDFNYDYGY